MSLGLVIEDVVEKNTHDNVVDVFAVALDLGCDFVTEFEHSTFKGLMRPCSQSDERLAEIALNKNNDEAMNRTVVSLLLSEYLMNIVHGRNKTVTIDAFFISDLRNYKMSPSVMVATRIAMPKSVIKVIDYPMFNTVDYANEAKLLPRFVSCTFKMSSSWILKTMQSSATAKLMKVINVRRKSDLKCAALISS